MVDIDELLKLPKEKLAKKLLNFDPKKRKEILMRFHPEERIRMIKLVDNEIKEQEKESDLMIRESIEQIERDERVKDIPVPEPENVDIDRLFKESELEEQVREEEPPELLEGQRNVVYGGPAGEQGIEYAANLYNELAELGQEGGPGYDTLSRAAEIYERLQDIGKYESQNEAVRNIAEGSSRIMEQLFGEYRAKQDYRPGG